jgi:hypothetical protein
MTSSVRATKCPGAKQTTHQSVCPICGCRASLKFEPDLARLFGGCIHFRAIIQRTDKVEIEYSAAMGVAA